MEKTIKKNKKFKKDIKTSPLKKEKVPYRSKTLENNFQKLFQKMQMNFVI